MIHIESVLSTHSPLPFLLLKISDEDDHSKGVKKRRGRDPAMTSVEPEAMKPRRMFSQAINACDKAECKPFLTIKRGLFFLCTHPTLVLISQYWILYTFPN
jgi:hypothetical protein